MRARRVAIAIAIAAVVSGVHSQSRPLANQQTYGIAGIGFVFTSPPRTFLTVGAQHRQDGTGRGHAMFSLLPGSHFSARLFEVERLTPELVPPQVAALEGFGGTIWCVAGEDMDMPGVNHIFFIADNGDGDTPATTDRFVHATGAACAAAVLLDPVGLAVTDGDFKAH